MRIVTLSSLVLAGCTTGVPHPPQGAHGNDEFTVIAVRPPPPRVQDVGPRPDTRAVWVDGEWAPLGGRWSWRRGGWVVPPQGATFAPWETRIEADGGLRYAPGTWHDGRGKAIEPPALIGRRSADGGRTTATAEDAGTSDGAADSGAVSP